MTQRCQSPRTVLLVATTAVVLAGGLPGGAAGAAAPPDGGSTAGAGDSAASAVAAAPSAPVATEPAAASADTLHPVTFVITTDPSQGTGSGTSDEQTARTGVRQQFDGWSQYWRTTSEGKVDYQLDGRYDDPATWYPGHGTCSSTSAQRDADYATAKAHVGYQSGPSKLFVLVVTNCNRDQGYGGGSSVLSGGSMYYEGYQSKGIWAHEIGHTLGFGHGVRLSCTNGSVDGPVFDEPGAAASGCTTYDYGDEIDVMGFSRASQYKALAAPHRYLEGFYGPESYYSVDSPLAQDQTLAVVPRALTSGRRTIVAEDPRSGTTYYFEYATPVGEDKGVVDNIKLDDFAGYTWNQKPGVRVLRESGNHAVLLSPPANAQNQRNAYWPVGTTFTTPDGGLSMNVVTQDDGSATLRVRTTPTLVPAPAAADDTATRRVDDRTPIDVLANDLPPAGQSIDTSSVVFPTAGQPVGATVSDAGRKLAVTNEGTYAVDPSTGAVTFTAAATYTGDTTPVTYQVAASGGETSTARLTITVTPLPTTPGPPPTTNPTPTTTTGAPAAGFPLRFTKTAPTKLKGTARVGGKVHTGLRRKLWRPTPTKATYRWHVGGHVVKNVTTRSLRLTPAYRGKKVWATVTLTRPGYESVTFRTRKLTVAPRQ